MALITLIADQRHMPYARQLITERIYANNNVGGDGIKRIGLTHPSTHHHYLQPMARMMPFYEPMPFDPYFELPPVTEGEIVDLSTVVIPIPPEALMPPPEQAANQEGKRVVTPYFFHRPNLHASAYSQRATSTTQMPNQRLRTIPLHMHRPTARSRQTRQTLSRPPRVMQQRQRRVAMPRQQSPITMSTPPSTRHGMRTTWQPCPDTM